MKKAIAIHWFRQDLRVADNPALVSATAYANVLPIYILDDKNCGDYAMGAASKFWLHHSLVALNKSLNGKLSVYQGDPIDVIHEIINRYDIKAIYWNRCYEPWRIARDLKVKEFLTSKGIEITSSNASLLWEPWDVKKNDGTPYKVFTPFYRKGCGEAPSPRLPITKPDISRYIKDDNALADIAELKLLPKIRWDKQLESHWQISEQGAHETFECFVENGLDNYKEGRNIPMKPYVSRLSPYLHFGQISPNQVWYGLRSIGDDKNIDHFCSELGWREFSYNLLYYNPDFPKKNLQKKFDDFPWIEDNDLLTAWQKGRTGVPMVDAGMRELWQTGYMHNRVRMIVGSFLVKNMRLHWRHGERWFWNTLLDADLANNSASWQWVAGCGADAAPYFRIFNPVMQGQKFDPDGEYIRKYIPEISSLPNKFLFNPWEAPKDILTHAGIKLGETYPHPIVDLKQSRNAALQAFAKQRNLETVL